MLLILKRLLYWVFDVIYKERESILYYGMKTPRSVLKNEAVNEFFLSNFEVF